MPEPNQLVSLTDGQPVIPNYNANKNIIEALLPTSEEKEALGTIGPQGVSIPNADGTLTDATRAINAIIAQMRSDGKIPP